MNYQLLFFDWSAHGNRFLHVSTLFMWFHEQQEFKPLFHSQTNKLQMIPLLLTLEHSCTMHNVHPLNKHTNILTWLQRCKCAAVHIKSGNSLLAYHAVLL